MNKNVKIFSSETTREAPYTYNTQTIPIVENFTFQNYVFFTQNKKINFSFLEWFIGFSEGDACFFSRIADNKVRLSFEIVQKDAQLLYKIRTTLNFGNVSSFTRHNQTYYKYTVENKKSIQNIMVLFNGNLILPKRYAQFKHWVQTGKHFCPENFFLQKTIVKVSLAHSWLSGFIEAEGCFYANFRSIYNNPDHSSFRQKLTITQKNVCGECAVLQEIIHLFQSNGKLRLLKKPDCYRIEFDSLKSQHYIVLYLQKFPLLGKKKITFLRWWRIYLRRQKLKPKIESLKTIQKLKKLCLMINNEN